jgi:O-succinylbenzoate synthase
MKIIRTDIYRFSISMTAPVNVGGRVLHDREGLLLALTDGEGRCAYGEIAPLPGFDSGTLERCLQDIPSVRRTLNDAPLDYERFQIADPLLGVIDVPVSSWSAHTLFGVESALMGLFLQCGRKRRPASGGLLMEEPLRIPVNALFIPDAAADRLGMQIRQLKDRGAGPV